MSKFNLNLPIEYCIVVSSSGSDRVFFEIGSTDMFGSALEELKELHAGNDKHQERVVCISTVSGNGPALARKMGYAGPVKFIDVPNQRCKNYPAWVFPTHKEWEKVGWENIVDKPE